MVNRERLTFAGFSFSVDLDSTLLLLNVAVP